jgi:hypothetical protein
VNTAKDLRALVAETDQPRVRDIRWFTPTLKGNFTRQKLRKYLAHVPSPATAACLAPRRSTGRGFRAEGPEVPRMAGDQEALARRFPRSPGCSDLASALQNNEEVAWEESVHQECSRAERKRVSIVLHPHAVSSWGPSRVTRRKRHTLRSNANSLEVGTSGKRQGLGGCGFSVIGDAGSQRDFLYPPCSY